jgi:hypothetical protein
LNITRLEKASKEAQHNTVIGHVLVEVLLGLLRSWQIDYEGYISVLMDLLTTDFLFVVMVVMVGLGLHAHWLKGCSSGGGGDLG